MAAYKEIASDHIDGAVCNTTEAIMGSHMVSAIFANAMTSRIWWPGVWNWNTEVACSCNFYLFF